MDIKGEINIILDNEIETDYFEIISYEEEKEFVIYIYTKNQRSYSDLINDKQLFSAMLHYFNKDAEIINELNSNNKIASYINEHSEVFFDFLQNAKEIYLDGSLEEFKKFVEKNKFSGDTKLIWLRKQPLTKDAVELLKNNFEMFDNIYFMVDGNEHFVSIAEYSQTVDYVDNIVAHVKELNFSTLEEDMYVFDLVRDREYSEEDNKDESYISRDLTSVVLGDKIVCAGFSALFNAILTKLGHTIMPFRLDAKTNAVAHQRNLEYVNDEKYGVEGLFFFDTTFGCKKKNKGNDFLSSYKYFAQTFKMFEKLDRGALKCKTYEYFEDSSIDAIENQLKREKYIFELFALIRFEDINKMLTFIGEKRIDYSQEIVPDDIIEKLFLISMLASRSINSKTFLKILYNVRKRQYYENPEKYLFDINIITEILAKSFVADDEPDPLDKLISFLSGIEMIVDEKKAENRVLKFMNEDSRELDMARIKLTRTLKNISDKRVL